MHTHGWWACILFYIHFMVGIVIKWKLLLINTMTADKSTNKELGQGKRLFRKPASQEKGGLASQKAILRTCRIQASFMSREGWGMGRVWGQEVIDNWIHLDVSKGSRGMVKLLCFWSTNSDCHGPSHNVPINLLPNNHYYMDTFLISFSTMKGPYLPVLFWAGKLFP